MKTKCHSIVKVAFVICFSKLFFSFVNFVETFFEIKF